MKAILDEYYGNGAKKIRKMVDSILFKLGISGSVDCEDFYSLANEVMCGVIKSYNADYPFDAFLYGCLERKIKTEMTRRNRKKRTADRLTISWETPLNDEDDTTIGDFIKDTKIAEHYDIDKTFFEDNGEKYSEAMLKYISRLSMEQKEVVKLLISGYEKDEIKNILHISESVYADCMKSIRAYRNIKILF